jgi:hypothetical protein
MMKRQMTFKVTKENRVYHITTVVDFTGADLNHLADLLTDSSSPRVRIQNTHLRPLSHIELERIARDGFEIHVDKIGKRAKVVVREMSLDEISTKAKNDPLYRAQLLRELQEQGVVQLSDQDLEEMENAEDDS